ncbi:conjugal transfer protein TraC [bacterium DOLZORAL124_38_8]|nr:MAG: conjugal transfer protein TraC [bacterium DOLZORAL124_38_8]
MVASNNAATNENEQILQDLFENFDPKTDKKKLNKKLRAKIIEAEKLYQSGVSDIKDLIAPSSLEVKPTHMKLNGLATKSYFVFSYPRYLETNWLNPIINFEATMDMSLFVYPIESARMMKILRKKVAEMQSTRRIQAKKGAVNDVSLDTALEDAESLRISLQRGTERFFQVGIYLTIYAENEEKLKVLGKQLETLLGGQLVMIRAADFQCERAFESTLPQCTDMLDIVRNMNTGPLSTTFPFVSNDLTSSEGILYGLNRHNNSLIIFDRFKMENANQVVFAKSGAGKSYAVKLDILRSLMMGTDVIVLDPENEYEELSRTVGGSYVHISLNSPHRINPFDLPAPIEGEDEPVGDALRENVINISGLMNLMLGKLNPTEQGIVDRAILQAYSLKGITQTTENPHEYEMPTMVDLQNILESMDGGKDMSVRLERFTTGTFSGLFSKQTNVDLTSGLVVFCIRDLEEQLRPIAMFLLLNFIWAKVRSELKKRLLVVDEAWNIVQYEDSGRFLHGLVKRARKYYLGITTITQDVEDFLESPWGKPIITNSSIQLLLRQSTVAIERLEKVFNLTTQEKTLLLNSGVGQGLFFAGNQHVAIQVIASYMEDKIITTNPEEVLAQQG